MALYPPYSTTFVGAVLTTGAPSSTYTVPVGKVAIISHASIVQTTPGSAAYLYLSWSQTGAVFIPFFTRKFAINADATDRACAVWDGHIAVPGGGQIRAQTLASTIGNATIAGYLLQA